MEETKVNVSLHTDKEGQAILTILEGMAPEHKIRQNVHLQSCDIKAPGLYYQSRKELIDPKKSFVNFSRSQGTIELVCNADDKETKDTVKGTLTPDDELKKLGINKGTKYGYQDLYDKIRWMRPYFPNQGEYLNIVSKLKHFKAKIDTSIEKSKSDTGSMVDQLIINVTQEVPLEFKMNAPIFKGQPAQEFTVNVIAQSEGSSIKYILESMELYDLEISIRNQIVDESLAMMIELVHIELA